MRSCLSLMKWQSGKWLVEIEGKISVHDLTRIPVGKVRVSRVGMAFDCLLSEIGVISKIKTTIQS
ncbi:hypothetical protein H4F60_12145 [Pectobacterium brasiliense]|nr:hypothetical protein [Pectobacterium brasiliense]